MNTFHFPTHLSGLSLLLTLGLSTAVGCGGTAQDSNAGDGDGDNSGDGDSNGDGDGDGDGDACGNLDNDSPGHLDILIRNERSTPIFLGPREPTCGTPPLFGVQDADGAELDVYTDGCTSTCEDWQSGIGVACPAICLYPEIVRIEPGEGYNAIWDTRYNLTFDPPDACDPDDFTCVIFRAIEPGTFTFHAEAGTALGCDDPSCPDCDTDSCSGGSVIAGDELEAEATAFLDASYGIYPSDGSGSSDSDAPGANYGVELTFTE